MESRDIALTIFNQKIDKLIDNALMRLLSSSRTFGSYSSSFSKSLMANS